MVNANLTSKCHNGTQTNQNGVLNTTNSLESCNLGACTAAAELS
jgi:hypothetical protein